jgi:hypothetical protein
MKYICTESAGARPGRDVARDHVGHRRTHRTRFRHARRGAGVTAGHCAVPASTRVCRPWQVAGPRGADPPASAPSVACHWPPEWRTSPAMPSTSLRGLVAPECSYLPQLTFTCAYKPVLAVPRAHAFLPSRRRPPLPPLGEHRVPVDSLAHPRAQALPCGPQYLPELRVDQAEPPFRRSPSLRDRHRTAAVELTPPPILQAL